MPMVAVSDGTWLSCSLRAGRADDLRFDPVETYAYYYAHLGRYAPGLPKGHQLKRGDRRPHLLAGRTGNASSNVPHLHFAIFLLGPEKQWWKGTPVNPYPLFVRR